MRIAVFLHGTSIMHKSAKGKSRKEIVEQVKEKDPSVHDYSSYIPVGSVVAKLNNWVKQGAEIIYLSSHKTEEGVEKDRGVLKRYNFPEGAVHYRRQDEEYKDVAERILPQVLIEDDCESIGGKEEMTYTYIDPELKRKIKLIEVKEFGGIDYLPDSTDELISY